MRQNFDPSLDLVLGHEGGFTDDPRDPGGPTNRGITQQVYDDWRKLHGLPQQSVRLIGDTEVAAIYLGRYWEPVQADNLPSGVDYATFDFAVNSGVGRASRFLQKVASVTQDGEIGPVTLAAIETLNPTEVIDALCGQRIAYLKQLPTFKTFGNGWTRRVTEVIAKAKEMAA